MLKDYFEVPNKPAIKSGNVLSCDFTDHETFIPQPLDFTRNTLATHVDCNGFIKVSGVIDTNLSPPEDFATDFNSNPVSGTAVNNPDGTITFTNSTSNGANVNLSNRNITVGKTYQIKFTISNYVQGNFRMSVGNQTTASVSTGNGTYIFYVTYSSGNSSNYFYTGNSTLTVSDISVKEVNLNVPRIDYLTEIGKAKELQKPSLLLEPQSTNVITYSEDFSRQNTPWNTTQNAVEFEYNSIIAPDNETKATKILKTSTRTYGNFFTGQAITSAVNYSWSCFFKAGTHSVFTLQLTQGDTEFKAYFDLDNQTSGMYTGSATTKIENYGNGWFRCSLAGVSSTTDLSVRFNLGLGYTTSNENWPNASDGEGLFGYIWGAQLEQQNYTTSYIPTSGSTVTRNGEVCNNAGSAPVFNSQEGTFYAEIAALADDFTAREMTLNGGNTSNRLVLSFNASNQIRVDYTVSSSLQVRFNRAADMTKFNKVAFKYEVDNFKLYLNGSVSGTDTSGSVPAAGTFNNFDFSNGSNNFNFYGRIKEIKAFRRTLTDSEMAELTNNIV